MKNYAGTYAHNLCCLQHKLTGSISVLRFCLLTQYTSIYFTRMQQIRGLSPSIKTTHMQVHVRSKILCPFIPTSSFLSALFYKKKDNFHLFISERYNSHKEIHKNYRHNIRVIRLYAIESCYFNSLSQMFCLKLKEKITKKTSHTVFSQTNFTVL